MFLTIPSERIGDFDMVKFAEHVLDTSPAIATRSQMRLVMKAVEAIATPVDGIAELAIDVAQAFQAACESAPIPELKLIRVDEAGNPFGEPIVVARRAYQAFYAAAEGMTVERPIATAAEHGAGAAGLV